MQKRLIKEYTLNLTWIQSMLSVLQISYKVFEVLKTFLTIPEPFKLDFSAQGLLDFEWLFSS